MSRNRPLQRRAESGVVAIEMQGASVVVSVAGALDYLRAAEFGKTLLAASDAGAVLVIDLSRCWYIDASVISALLLARRTRERLRVVVAGGSLPQRILRIAEVDDALGVVTTLEEAMSA